jgi:hypothetical protein
MTTATRESLRKGNLTTLLFANSGYLFLALAASALLAFWPRYIANPFGKDFRFHIHAAAMGGWCTLLIAESLLIRVGQGDGIGGSEHCRT